MKKAIKQRFAVFLMMCIFSVSLCGCYDAQEIDELAYVIAIGLETGKVNTLKLTLQLAIPKSIGSGEDAGGEKTFTTASVEGPSIYSCLNLANTFISRKLNLSHAHIIVVSEELARKGIKRYMHAINRGRELRGGMLFAVSKCSAEEFLKSIQPPLESNPRKYYELLHKSFEYTGFTTEVDFLKFYIYSESSCTQPVAVLANISKYENSEEFKLEDSTFMEKGREEPLAGDYIAGNIPQASEWKNQRMGLAVFRDETMVGELDGQESMLHSIIHNVFVRSYVTIDDPIEKNKYIVLNLSKGRDTEKKIQIEGENPRISVKVYLEGEIVSIQSDINYEKPEKLATLEAHFEEFYKKEFMRYLEKTAKEFNSDICGFGMEAKKQYLTWDEWMAVNWLEIYKNSSFDVEVTFKVRRTGLMLRSHEEFGGVE